MNSTALVFQFLGKAVCGARSCGAAFATVLLVASTFFGSLPELQAQESHRFVSTENFERQMESPVGVTWRGKDLRGALESLSQSQKIAIFLDRRIDPGQELNYVADSMPLEELLLRLCTQLRLGYCRVGEVIYIGPPETAEVLETVAALRRQEEESLSNERRRGLTRDRASGWNALAQPRELLVAAAADASVGFADQDRVPHDLWPAVELPPLRFADRATLILAGFGLTYALDDDGVAMAIVPLPSEAVIEEAFPRGNHGNDVVAQLSERFPESEIRGEAERIVVVGPMQDQRLIGRLLAGQQVRRRRVDDAEQVYTLTVENQTVGAIVRALAQRLEMEVEIDPGLTNQLDDRVSFAVESVSLDELLAAALAPAGLRAEIGEDTIRVKRAD